MMFKVFPRRVYELRMEKGLTQEQLADLVGVGKTTISNYESAYSTPTNKNLHRLAQVFHVSTAYLTGESDLRERYSELIDGIRIPLLNYLDPEALAHGNEAHAECIIELPKNAQLRDDKFFAIQMWNDSMEVDHIFKNDLIILRRTTEINNGRIYLVISDGLAYLRRVSRKGNILTLSPNSEKRKYKPLQVSIEQADIIGCAVKVITTVF